MGHDRLSPAVHGSLERQFVGRIAKLRTPQEIHFDGLS